MQRCDVIITYSWNRVGYNILRSLTDKGLKVVVGDISKNNICSLSNRIVDSFIYPDPLIKEDEFIEVLLDKIKYYQPLMLIPTHDEGIIIAKYRNKFPANLIIPIDSYDKLCAVSNKAISMQYASEVNVPVPKCYSYDDIIKSYPIVFKTRMGNSAKGVFFPNSIEELDKLKSQYETKDVLIQEKIDGIDHSVDCIRADNFFYASVYRALITKTSEGGTTTQRIIVDIPELIEYAKKILDYINYQGVCGLDFKYNPITKKCAFIEVNARYTGGLATPIKAGFNIPYIHYCLFATGNYTDPIFLKIGTKTKWILGDFITLVERCMKLKLKWSDVKSFFNFTFDGFDDFFYDDKKAFWGECRYYLIKLWRNKKLNP